jgi:hypothetical protein
VVARGDDGGGGNKQQSRGGFQGGRVVLFVAMEVAATIPTTPTVIISVKSAASWVILLFGVGNDSIRTTLAWTRRQMRRPLLTPLIQLGTQIVPLLITSQVISTD